MVPDPVCVEDCRAWLNRAAEDLATARILLRSTPVGIRPILFHCQQAIEKALKAFLTWHDVPFRKTHDLARLGKQCLTIESALEPIVTEAEVLSAYAWRFRYPGAPYEPTLEEAQTAFSLAEETVNAILSRLPAETHPSL